MNVILLLSLAYTVAIIQFSRSVSCPVVSVHIKCCTPKKYTSSRILSLNVKSELDVCVRVQLTSSKLFGAGGFFFSFFFSTVLCFLRASLW